MARNTNKTPKNSQAIVKPEIVAEKSVAEAEKSASQAATQAETGNEAVSEAGNSPIPGGTSSLVQGLMESAGLSQVEGAQALTFEVPLECAPLVSGASGGSDGVFATHIIVSAAKDGFRRAGRAWSKAATTVSLDEFSKEQLDAIVTEPMLSVAFLAE